MKKNRLFGTDGIRGQYRQWPLTRTLILNVSFAFGKWLKKKFKNKGSIRVIIGQDTRASGKTIEQYLAYGLQKSGINVYSVGVIPTPGLAYLAKNLDVELGIMISASHNLASDNGIKFFKHNGFKLSELEEREIERIAFSLLKKKKQPRNLKRKRIVLEKVSAKPYLEYLKSCVSGLNLKGLRIVIDCANGAVSNYAQRLMVDLGARVFALHCNPNGLNINLNCGSLHPKRAALYIKEKHAQIGFSFDGDGDRVILSDEKGRILDGDYIMAFVAKHFLKKRRLAGKIVVATSMSNFGLEKFLKKINVRLIRADVGDKFVLKELINHKASFGGEQSGHIIFLDQATTGDGLLTGLKILQIMQETGKPVSKLVTNFRKYPQLLCNVRVKEKKDFKKMPLVWKKIQEAQNKLKGNGRLVIRYSGTEPLARIMVEGDNKSGIKRIAKSISCAIDKEIGC